MKKTSGESASAASPESSAPNTDGKIRRMFRASTFFNPDFSFHIVRMRHTPDDYDESYSCQREFWKIIYVISGSGWKIINDRRYPLKAGSLFLIHPLDRTTFQIDPPAIEIYNILFQPPLIANGLRELRNDFNFFSIFNSQLDPGLEPEFREQLYVLDSGADIEALIRRLDREYRRREPNCKGLIKLQLLELLILICRRAARKLKSLRRRGVADFVNAVIEKHYAEDFDYDFLAAEIGIGKSHLCRLYRNACGASVSERLLERRIKAAREKLVSQPDRNISDICYECGFNDLSYFYRAFSAACGVNPGRYRKQTVRKT